MKLRNKSEKILSATAIVGAVTILCAAGAWAADIPADSVKLAPGVMKAAEGYESPPAMYVVANPTDVFNDHYFYNTRVTGSLKRGEKLDALAKVKGWDWVLVGKNGTGIGYVAISMLSPADKYIP